MGYSTPPTAVAGLQLSAADWNAKVRDSMEAVAKPPRCRVRKNANFSPANAAFTAAAFDVPDVGSLEYNTDAIWAAGTPTRLTAPVSGVYACAAGGAFTANATGIRLLYLVQNFTFTTAGIIATDSTPANAGFYNMLNVYGEAYFDAGDYFEALFWQNSGAGLAVDTAASNIPIWASMHLIAYA